MADDANTALRQEVEKLKLELEKAETQQKIESARKPPPPPAPAAPVSAGQLALDQATLEASLAEQKKKALTQSLPTTTATALEGTTTVDDKAGGMETKTLAYESVEAIAGEIAGRVEKLPGITRLVIYDDKDVAGLRQRAVFMAQVKLLREGFKAVTAAEARPRVTSEAVEPVTAGLKSVIDLLALFRSNVELKGRDATVDRDALVSAVAHRLDLGRITVVHPGLFPQLPRDEDIAGTTVFVELEGLARDREAAAEVVRQAEAEKKPSAATLRARFDSQVTVHDAFVAGLVKPDATTGHVPLAGILQAEGVKGAGTFVLVLKGLEAGGTVRTNRNLWSFLSWPWVSYSGAAIVNMMVFDTAGRLVSSDVLYRHSGFTRIRPAPRPPNPGRNFPRRDLDGDVRRQLAAVLKEAVDGKSGSWTYFIDNAPGGGLLGTLAELSIDQAWKEVGGSTIAAHVHHLEFALRVAADRIDGTDGPVDWSESWKIARVDAEWPALVANVGTHSQRLAAAIGARGTWSEAALGEALGAVAHVAYHLGAIRQKVALVR